MHYSYDYAKQVHIPSTPQQLCPIYFKTPRNVVYLGYGVREYPDRSVTSLMRQFLPEKVPIEPSAMCMTFSVLTGQGRQMHRLMQILVGDKTKTILLSGATPGKFFVGSTNQYCIHF